ncbi:hypothetical protein [Lacrimispora indolis]|uniref:hypothetical protein n=1 Tax=Lacrimispora indolis TaxID=69825 RepID=UPI00045EA63A|nr:hypothetical protein [Lacrimispora indolis]
MRQSVILPSTHDHIFLYEAQDSGLVKRIPSYADELYDSNELKMAEEDYKNHLRSIPGLKQELFQSILLFDEIILDKADMNYNYKDLEETGLFRVIDFEKSYYYNPMQEEGHIEYAGYLEPAIIPVLLKRLNRYFPLIPKGINFTKFVTAFYEMVLMKKKLTKEYHNLIEINKKEFDKKYKFDKWYGRLKSFQAPSIMLEGRYYYDIQSHVITLYDSLCWQLMISSDYESAIMNSEFELVKIGCESFTGNIDLSLQAYRILQVECSKLIGTLPEVNTMRDMLKLKETRKNDINNLRRELSYLEQILRDGGTEKTIERIAKDIKKASKALSTGNNIREVGKWVNRFLIPADLCTGLLSISSESIIPKIALGGLLMATAIGQTAPEISEFIESKHKWFEVVTK